MIECSTTQACIESSSTMALGLVIGVLVLMYIMYYWQANKAKHKRQLKRIPNTMYFSKSDFPSLSMHSTSSKMNYTSSNYQKPN